MINFVTRFVFVGCCHSRHVHKYTGREESYVKILYCFGNNHKTNDKNKFDSIVIPMFYGICIGSRDSAASTICKRHYEFNYHSMRQWKMRYNNLYR
jgi:hypothetical protein